MALPLNVSQQEVMWEGKKSENHGGQVIALVVQGASTLLS